jgi:SAM-dependent methyltransferase
MSVLDEALRLREHYANLRTFDQRMQNPGFRHMFRERNNALVDLLPRLPRSLPACRILDFGCGHGVMSDWLRNHGAQPEHLVGVDIQPDRIARARKLYPDLTFVEATGECLPFPDDTRFDVIIAFTVFSSILDPGIAQRVATELTSALAAGGVIIWYDIRYPNPANPNLRPMPLLRVRQLFPLLDDELKSLTLLPPLAERLGSWTEVLYPKLAALPPLRSHYFGLLKKEG